MSLPVVSIVMPAYRSERTIAESVNSVIAQTFKDWELIIIVDISGDKTVENIPKDNRITVVQNKTRLGLATSRNKGVKLAKGKMVAFLDSDDIWREDKLDKQLAFMYDKNAKISYTASAYIGSNYIMRAIERLHFKKLLHRNIMTCSSIIAERELVVKYPFPKGIITEDFAVWLTIVKEVGVAFGLNEPLVSYRLSKNSDSSSKYKMAIKTYRTYRHLDVNPIFATTLIINYAIWVIRKRRLILKGAMQDGFKKGNY